MEMPCDECLKYPICKHKSTIYCDLLYRHWMLFRDGKAIFPNYMFPHLTTIGVMPEFVKREGFTT